MLERVWRKGNPPHCWWESKLVQPLWETLWRFIKKLELPYNPAIPLVGICPDKTIIQRDTCKPMFIAALLTIAKTWKQPKCPLTDEWIKMWCVCVCVCVCVCMYVCMYMYIYIYFFFSHWNTTQP